MPSAPVPAELVPFIRQANPAVIGTLRADGSPHTVPTWYLWADGDVLVSMDASRRRLEHMRDDPRVSLTVIDADDWYHHVSFRGRVTKLEADDGLAEIDRIARHYTGEAYFDRTRERVTATIAIDTWHTWARGQSTEAG